MSPPPSGPLRAFRERNNGFSRRRLTLDLRPNDDAAASLAFAVASPRAPDSGVSSFTTRPKASCATGGKRVSGAAKATIKRGFVHEWPGLSVRFRAIYAVAARR